MRLAMVDLAMLGLGIATYLTYVHYSGAHVACTAGQSCVRVQTSQWSRLDGLPVAVIRLIGYLAILATLLAPDREATRMAVLGLTLVGVGFSGYLTYRELFSIHAICEWCVSSALIMTALLAGAAIRYLSAGASVPTDRGAPLHRSSDSAAR
jgi:uncharacterized membrane protein